MITGDIMKLLLIWGVNQEIEKKGQERWWLYNYISELRKQVFMFIIDLNRNKNENQNRVKIQEKYFNICAHSTGFFPGCYLCKNKCFFNLEAKRLLRIDDMKYVLSILSDENIENADREKKFVDEIRGLIKMIAMANKIDYERELLFCMGLEIFSQANLSDFQAKNFSNKFVLAIEQSFN